MEFTKKDTHKMFEDFCNLDSAQLQRAFICFMYWKMEDKLNWRKTRKEANAFFELFKNNLESIQTKTV